MSKSISTHDLLMKSMSKSMFTHERIHLYCNQKTILSSRPDKCPGRAGHLTNVRAGPGGPGHLGSHRVAGREARPPLPCQPSLPVGCRCAAAAAPSRRRRRLSPETRLSRCAGHGTSFPGAGGAKWRLGVSDSPPGPSAAQGTVTRSPSPNAPIRCRAENMLRPRRAGLGLNLKPQPPARSAPYAARQQPAECGRRAWGARWRVRCEVVVGRAATASAAGMTGAVVSRSPSAPQIMRRIEAFCSALLDRPHVPASRSRRVMTRGERRVQAVRGAGRKKEAATQASMAGRGWCKSRAGARRRAGNKQRRKNRSCLDSLFEGSLIDRFQEFNSNISYHWRCCSPLSICQVPS